MTRHDCIGPSIGLLMEITDYFSTILLDITLHIGQTLLTKQDVSGSLYVILHVCFNRTYKILVGVQAG